MAAKASAMQFPVPVRQHLLPMNRKFWTVDCKGTSACIKCCAEIDSKTLDRQRSGRDI